jgi:Flp pilus assembly protein TadB
MDHARDDDAALRSLGEDLARDDPRLAALLDGTAPLPPRRRVRTLFVLLLITPVLSTLALLVPPTVAVGAVAILLAAASPVAVCWLCAADRPDPPLR